MNFYIYLLVVLNWPVLSYKSEFELAEEKNDEEVAAAANADGPEQNENASPDVKRFRANAPGIELRAMPGTSAFDIEADEGARI